MNNKTVSSGVGIEMVLFLIFLILKLTGTGSVASWSWWWVTCPLWIPIALFGIILLIGAIAVLISGSRKD